MKLLLIRHGESTSDVEDRYGGDYDDHLTAVGRSQAKSLARELADSSVEIIYTSPKLRTLETAQVLQKALRRPLEILVDLRERNNYGVMTGMTRQEAQALYPDQAKLLERFDSTITGAEPYQDFKRRILEMWQQLATAPFSKIAVITHGGPIRLLFREVFQLGGLTELGDCAVITIEHENGQLRVVNMQNATLTPNP